MFLRDKEIKLDAVVALKNLGLLKGYEKKPTNLALLFFAKNIYELIPQAEIKLTRFNGTEPINIVNSQKINATILDAIEKTIDFIKINTSVQLEIEGLRRKNNEEYPLKVIREAVINAIGHRDYFNKNSLQVNIFDDRIEITNPGTLPNGVIFAQLGRISVHRNPHLYRLISQVGYGEGLGTGIPRMIEAMRINKLPDPAFEELGDFFRIILYNQKSSKKIKDLELTDIQKQIFSILNESNSIKAHALVQKTKYSLPTVINVLNEIEKRGLIKKIGKTRGAYYIKKVN